MLKKIISMHKKVINKFCLLYVIANIFKIKRENENINKNKIEI